MKIKKCIAILLVMVVVLPCTMLCACNKELQNQEQSTPHEITSLEREIMGHWIFDDAKMLNESSGNYLYYSDGSEAFQDTVIWQYDVATLIFTDEKSGEQLKGSFVVGDDSYDFMWKRTAAKVIEITPFITIEYGDLTSPKVEQVRRIYVGDDCAYVNMLLGGATVFYYFSKKAEG